MTASLPLLPPGQRAIAGFPRFGLPPFAGRFPRELDTVRLDVQGDVAAPLTLEGELAGLPRVEQVSDLHCVTTWTRRALVWSGFRFSDLYERLLLPLARPTAEPVLVVLRAQDGYRSSLPLEDLLAPDVLLADRLDGEPLSIEHGAPLRLVAPAHYGYKNVKHLRRLDLRLGPVAPQRPFGFRFLDHPRGRVALEERGQGFPGWLLRYLYRPLIRPTAARFARAMRERSAGESGGGETPDRRGGR
jgi:DMSO/TMAO reductase YedYZ molybdopterin-dependent catalytic subunit